jgi:hypothetical protein
MEGYMGTDPVQIYTPGGMVNSAAIKVESKLREYDERLCFGFNPANRDWIAYVKMPRDFDAAYYIDGYPVYPVYGFGNDIPEPDEALYKIMSIDTQRHPHLLEKMNKANARVQAEQEALLEEVYEETAERIEHALRKEGETKFSKVFMSGGSRARKRNA